MIESSKELWHGNLLSRTVLVCGISAYDFVIGRNFQYRWTRFAAIDLRHSYRLLPRARIVAFFKHIQMQIFRIPIFVGHHNDLARTADRRRHRSAAQNPTYQDAFHSLRTQILFRGLRIKCRINASSAEDRLSGDMCRGIQKGVQFCFRIEYVKAKDLRRPGE